MTTRPRIAITMGDPAGVGPELCLRMLGEPRVLAACVPVVFGDAGVLARVAEACRLGLPEDADMHLNTRGNEVLAEELAAWLDEHPEVLVTKP